MFLLLSVQGTATIKAMPPTFPIVPSRNSHSQVTRLTPSPLHLLVTWLSPPKLWNPHVSEACPPLLLTYTVAELASYLLTLMILPLWNRVAAEKFLLSQELLFPASLLSGCGHWARFSQWNMSRSDVLHLEVFLTYHTTTIHTLFCLPPAMCKPWWDKMLLAWWGNHCMEESYCMEETMYWTSARGRNIFLLFFF